MDLQGNRRYYSPDEPEKSGAGSPTNAGSPTGAGSQMRSGSGSALNKPQPETAVTPSSGIWNILARIWAVWVILVFVITMLLFLIPFLLFSYSRKDPKKTRRFISLSRVWMGI